MPLTASEFDAGITTISITGSRDGSDSRRVSCDASSTVANVGGGGCAVGVDDGLITTNGTVFAGRLVVLVYIPSAIVVVVVADDDIVDIVDVVDVDVCCSVSSVAKNWFI